MKLTHHKDGSYSITEMTREDVSSLAMGASTACAFYAKSYSADATERVWNGENTQMFDNLHRVLHIVEESRSTGSIVTAQTLYGDPTRENRYKIQTRRGLLSWAEYDAARGVS